MRRVVITGIGAVSALGLTANATYEAACAGTCGIRPLEIAGRETYPQPVKPAVGGQIFGLPAPDDDDSAATLQDRSTRLCMMAAREAVGEAGLSFEGKLASRTAVVAGTGIGGFETTDNGAHRIYFEHRPRVHPFSVPRTMPSAGASHVSIEFGIRGPVFALTSACASAAHAIGEAALMIRYGRADAAIAGGTEAPLMLSGIIAWHALRVMTADKCRPFSANRTGMALAEGAGMFVLEEMEAARARGATILCELAGYGLSADAGSMVDPSPEGCADAIRQCLVDAQLAPGDVGYVNAHGTGTRANDRTETEALHRAFGPALDRVWVSSTKSMHGHALGASPAIELAIAVRALQAGILPPTINLDHVDPECDLRHVRNEAVSERVDAIVSNSFAFGGLNAALAIRRAG